MPSNNGVISVLVPELFFFLVFLCRGLCIFDYLLLICLYTSAVHIFIWYALSCRAQCGAPAHHRGLLLFTSVAENKWTHHSRWEETMPSILTKQKTVWCLGCITKPKKPKVDATHTACDWTTPNCTAVKDAFDISESITSYMLILLSVLWRTKPPFCATNILIFLIVRSQYKKIIRYHWCRQSESCMQYANILKWFCSLFNILPWK